MKIIMTINLTLAEVLDRCNDWETFCAKEGWCIWAVNEGGGDIEVSLSYEEAKGYGIVE